VSATKGISALAGGALGQEIATCKNITLDLCSLPPGEIITTVTASGPDNCEAFCGIYAACLTWVYRTITGTGENCDLVAMDIVDYHKTCQEFGGIEGVNFEECTQTGNEALCRGFSSGGCAFQGAVLETLPNIANYGLCQTGADLRGAKYWVYNLETDECVLYDNDVQRECNTQRGPGPNDDQGSHNC